MVQKVKSKGRPSPRFLKREVGFGKFWQKKIESVTSRNLPYLRALFVASEIFVPKTMPRTRPNYLYAIVSVALVLFVLGFFALMALHGQKLVTMFKEKVDLWLELKPGLAEADRERQSLG